MLLSFMALGAKSANNLDSPRIPITIVPGIAKSFTDLFIATLLSMKVFRLAEREHLFTVINIMHAYVPLFSIE